MINFLFTQTPLKYMVQSFWRDEAFSYLLAKQHFFNILPLTAKDYNPPLYYLVLHFWMKIFGSSELSLRLISLIFYWGTIYVVFLFLKNILKINQTYWLFLYLLLFLINPLLNYYAFEARMYMPFAFLSTLSFYFFWTKKIKNYVLTSILGLYTHYFMLFVIFSQLLFNVIIYKNSRELQRSLINFCKIFIFFIPWIIFVLIQKNIDASFWITKPSLGSFISLPTIIYTGYENELNFYKERLTLFALFFICLIVLTPFYLKAKKKPAYLFFFLIWSIFSPFLTFIISFYKPIFLPRYLIFANVGMILFIIGVFEQINLKLRIIMFVTLVTLTLNYNQIEIKNREKEDVRKAVNEIKTLTNRNDLLYVTSELYFHTAQYYFNENKVFIYGKSYEEIPIFVGKVLIPKEKVVNTLPYYPQRAFILKNNLTYDIQAIY